MGTHRTHPRKAPAVARKTILVDDLDGTAEETVATRDYTLGDTTYEIDLTAEHAEELCDLVEQIGRYIAASRTPAAHNGTRRPSAGPGYDPAEVRAWARANGVPVSEKGRIAGDVVRQWRAATADPAA